MQKIMAMDELPMGEAKSVMIDDHEIIIVHAEEGFRAFLNWCPHLGIELNFMPDQFLDPEGRYLFCANHGALFEPDQGACIAGPCAGDRLVAVDIIEKDQFVHLVKLPDNPRI